MRLQHAWLQSHTSLASTSDGHSSAPSPTRPLLSSSDSVDWEKAEFGLTTSLSPKMSPAFKLEIFDKNTIFHHVANDDDSPRLMPLLQRNSGLFLAIFAQFLYSTMSLFFKLLSNYSEINREPIPTLQIIFLRMIMTWLGCTFYMIYKEIPDPILGPKGVRHLLLARGVFGFASLFSWYYSLNKLALADSTFLTFLTPVGTAFLSWIFLRETFTVPEMVAGLVSLIGVLLIARPTFAFSSILSMATMTTTSKDTWKRQQKQSQMDIESEGARLFAVFITLVCVCAAGGAYTLMRRIGKRASAAHTVSYFAMISTFASPIVMYWNGEQWVVPTRPVWVILLILVGFFGLGAQVLVALALQREKASLVSSMIYSQIIWTTLFQVAILHHPIELLSICGCLLITLAAIFTTASKSSYAAK